MPDNDGPPVWALRPVKPCPVCGGPNDRNGLGQRHCTPPEPVRLIKAEPCPVEYCVRVSGHRDAHFDQNGEVLAETTEAPNLGEWLLSPGGRADNVMDSLYCVRVPGHSDHHMDRDGDWFRC